jgi:low temperature requirement protein LtrA
MSRLSSPPRLRTGAHAEEERHASWLELFFDLVFVIAITELGEGLSHDVSLDGFLVFLGLFVPVWWSWIGYTFYADRFESEGVPYRLAVFGGMLAVAALAVNVADVFHGHSTGFAVSYIAGRVIVIALYERARRLVPEAREICAFYATGFTIGALIWLASLATPPPLRYLLWGVGLVVELATPLVARRLIDRIPVHATHIPERFALFTMIVFGESVIAVATATKSTNWDANSAAVAVVGFVAVVCLWWIYFDFVDREEPLRHGVARGQTFVYGHLPLLASLTVIAVGMKLGILAAAGEIDLAEARVSLGAGVPAYLVVLSVILVVCQPAYSRRVLAARLLAAAAAAVLAAVGGGLNAVGFTGGLAFVLVLELAAEVGDSIRRPIQTLAPSQ